MSEPSDSPQQQQKLRISSVAHAKMVLHCVRYDTSQVHGILIGRYAAGLTLEVEDCVPVCHAAPTKPLLDTAFRMVEAANADRSDRMVVGWYTANERVDDLRPGQAALRIVSSIAAATKASVPPHAEPLVVVINSATLGEIMADGSEQQQRRNPVEAFGRDHRKHWLLPVPAGAVIFTDEHAEAVRRVCHLDDYEQYPIYDFESHLEAVDGDQVAERDWLTNQKVTTEFKVA